MNDRIVKSISFKLSDPIEGILLTHALKHSNFSVYVKRLIQRDAEGGFFPSSTPPIIKKSDPEIDESFF